MGSAAVVPKAGGGATRVETTGPIRINALVPELCVSDRRASVGFHCRLPGFPVADDRPEQGFAFLALGEAQLMVDQIGLGRDVDDVPRERLGLGPNLQVKVDALEPVLARLHAAGVPLRLAPEERWHRSGEREFGQRQAVVADPDGYLLRLVEPLGTRPAPSLAPV
jgi:catechol 2,3-dioxygenase-like lactoylglutathione lyase family enzyme